MKQVHLRLLPFFNKRKTRIRRTKGFTVIEKQKPLEITVIERISESARGIIESFQKRHEVYFVVTWKKTKGSQVLKYTHMTNESTVHRAHFVSIHLEQEFQIFSKIENIEKVTL